jgi:hypothetical protein
MSRVLFGRVAGGLIAAASLCAVVLTAPGIAFADTYASLYTVYQRSGDDVFNVQHNPSDGGQWHLAAVRSYPGQDFDLNVISVGTGRTAPSDAYAGNTDFVAIDAWRMPSNTYRAQVYRWGGDGSAGYDFQLAPGDNFTPTVYGQWYWHGNDQWDYDPTIQRDGDVAQIYNVYLQAGQYYVLKSAYNWLDDGNVFLVSPSDPANSATWMRGRFSTLQVTTKNVGVSSGGCTRFRATRTAAYGLVVLFDDHNGGYHSYETVDVEKATSSQGTYCDQAGDR